MKIQEIATDPIIEELHQIRRDLVREAGGTLHALGVSLMSSQGAHGPRLALDRPQARPNWEAVAKKTAR